MQINRPTLTAKPSKALIVLVIRSTLQQSRPNKAALKCPSVHTCITYVRLSVHRRFFDFIDIGM